MLRKIKRGERSRNCNRRKGNKGEAHFGWIFSIIVGAVILFITFFFLSRQIFVQETKSTTEQAHGLDILLGPFTQLGAIAEASSDEISLSEETSLGFKCFNEGLGYDSITVIGEKGAVSTKKVYDKYIFAEDMKSKDISLISKSFEMPFRTADLIFLAQKEKNYCFVNSPYDIENELGSFDIENIELRNSESECVLLDPVKVCFISGSSTGYCNVKIYDKSQGNFEYGEVKKGSSKVNFVGTSLLYGAIFSSKEVYDCNLERLIARTELLVKIYKDKARDLSQKGCEENYYPMLDAIGNAASSLNTDSINSLILLYATANNLDNINSRATCSLY